MRVVLYPEVYSDIAQIMAYYEEIASTDLANDVYVELRRSMKEAAVRPDSFAICTGGLRRANLHRFPYQFLIRVVGDEVRILFGGHHSKRPSLGIRRR